ncbi:hypothetical protein MN608_11713 [Microdochium nivale]|nr:hypothetical protein MN608_11713 [Microdochium nivale]
MFSKIFTAATLLTAVSAGCVRPSATSSAAPSVPTTIPAGGKFSIMSLRSASPIHFAQTSAQQSRLILSAPSNDAVCAGDNFGAAVFYIKDGGLFLYTADGAPTQRMWVDASGMGQGIMGYSTGDESISARGSITGFALDESDNLTFNGNGFLACPGAVSGGWGIWAASGNNQPAGIQGCLGFSARAVAQAEPFTCEYSKQKPV